VDAVAAPQKPAAGCRLATAEGPKAGTRRWPSRRQNQGPSLSSGQNPGGVARSRGVVLRPQPEELARPPANLCQRFLPCGPDRWLVNQSNQARAGVNTLAITWPSPRRAPIPLPLMTQTMSPAGCRPNWRWRTACGVRCGDRGVKEARRRGIAEHLQPFAGTPPARPPRNAGRACGGACDQIAANPVERPGRRTLPWGSTNLLWPSAADAVHGARRLPPAARSPLLQALTQALQSSPSKVPSDPGLLGHGPAPGP